jgi:hypothetical protein
MDNPLNIRYWSRRNVLLGQIAIAYTKNITFLGQLINPRLSVKCPGEVFSGFNSLSDKPIYLSVLSSALNTLSSAFSGIPVAYQKSAKIRTKFIRRCTLP